MEHNRVVRDLYAFRSACFVFIFLFLRGGLHATQTRAARNAHVSQGPPGARFMAGPPAGQTLQFQAPVSGAWWSRSARSERSPTTWQELGQAQPKTKSSFWRRVFRSFAHTRAKVFQLNAL